MSNSRYPENRYTPRDRSPPRYPNSFVPRGPRALGDSRGPGSGPPSGIPSGPREGRGRGFPGRSERPQLRDAPPLSERLERRPNDRDRGWDRDRDRDFERRDRRPSPRGRSPRSRSPRRSPRARSPLRDSRDSRYVPRDIDIGRARRNSRDGPLSAGSTYSDPAPGGGQSYRGGGFGRGRGGRDWEFRGRGRGSHNHHFDDRDRRGPYRPRSRSREPFRRDRDVIRDDRDLDRRDDRRFERRDDERRDRYDSYVGPASINTRITDGRHAGAAGETRHVSGTSTGPNTPHPLSATHSFPHDRIAAQDDPSSRRSSLATEPLGAQDPRSELHRAVASRDRLPPRVSTPPSAPQVPAFGSLPNRIYPATVSNVWRNPALDARSNSQTAPSNQPSAASSAPMASSSAASAAPAPSVVSRSQASVPSGLVAAPPTGPRASRGSDRPPGAPPPQDNRPPVSETPRIENSSPAVPAPLTQTATAGVSNTIERKPQAPAGSPHSGPVSTSRPPHTGPQAGLSANASPSQPFSRPTQAPFSVRDASPNSIPLGPRNPSLSTSPKTVPGSIPTGPKAERTPSIGSRPVFGGPDRSPFPPSRAPNGGPLRSHQWTRPGLRGSAISNAPATSTTPAVLSPPAVQSSPAVQNAASAQNTPTIQNTPAVLNLPVSQHTGVVSNKREFTGDERERPFGSAPKAPRLEPNIQSPGTRKAEDRKPDSPVPDMPKSVPGVSTVHKVTTTDAQQDNTEAIQVAIMRRLSDVSMHDASPTSEKALMMGDSEDDDFDLDEADFAESEAKYNKEKALLESKLIDLSKPCYRAMNALEEIILLASITAEHLPRHEQQIDQQQIQANEEGIQEADIYQEESIASPKADQALEGSTADLLTPKEDGAEDVVMHEGSPTTAAETLAPQLDVSVDRESSPEMNPLPYLGKGPLTPLSEQDLDELPESIILAVRDTLKVEAARIGDPEDALAEYKKAYKAWRLHVQELDEEKEHEEQERQISAEPGYKVTTPDVVSSTMPPLLEAPPTSVGRRGHPSRWATELDLEQVLKESLKTAEEEKQGKKDQGPRELMWDPEREAMLPMQMTEYEIRRRRFIDTNFQREPSQGIFVYHYEPPEDDFTEIEHKIMVQHYKEQPKKWGKLAEILRKEAGTNRSYKDCINHYYATKWGREYKPKAKGRRGRAAKAKTARSRTSAAPERPELYGDEGLAAHSTTESGRPKRAAAPTFGGPESELESVTPAPTPARGRRQDHGEGVIEKARGRGKAGKEKGGRKPKNQTLAAAPVDSPVKTDRKEKISGVKTEEGLAKRSVEDLQVPMGQAPVVMEEQTIYQPDPSLQVGSTSQMIERPRANTNQRPGPSSYWSVVETNDFKRNVAHFGTDWAAIASHMGTKTQTMVKNQYQRIVEKGKDPELEHWAQQADARRERGEDLGPPPIPTSAPKRRYDSQPDPSRQMMHTPEATDVVNASTAPPISLPPTSSPTLFASGVAPGRFSAIAQAPRPTQPMVSTPGISAVSEPPVLLTSTVTQQSTPPNQLPRTQPLHHHHQQQHPHPLAHSHAHAHKSSQPGPRAGFFSDNLPPRAENRPTSQSSAMPQPRPSATQLPPQLRAALTQDTPFRQPFQAERTDGQPIFDHPHDHESQARYQGHARRISQETHQRQYPTNAPAPAPAQLLSQVHSIPSNTASPETHSLPAQEPQQPQKLPRAGQAQTPLQASIEPSSQPVARPPSSLAAAQHPASGLMTGAPPVKEEVRHYPLPTQPPPAQLQTKFQAPLQHHAPPHVVAQVPSPAPPPPPKPAAEPRKSDVFSLLNDTEPEEPRRKKPAEPSMPSHPPTPQQQGPIAPPPPIAQQLPARRDGFTEPNISQSPFSRNSYAQHSVTPQAPSGRQAVDHSRDQPANTLSQAREAFQNRQSYQPPQSQAQQAPSMGSPHHLAQPGHPDARVFSGNHRAVFAQHNTPRHNPSPPPHGAYNHSPHMHSRTPSITHPVPPQQPRHSIANTAPSSHASTPGPTAQILQANPYAQVEAPGSTSQPSGPVGMRPSPHLHTSQIALQRDIQKRNEQSQGHSGNLPYSNPQTPNEMHSTRSHPRGPSIPDPYRPRDLRDHEFDARNRERDVSRELSHMSDVMMHEQRREPLVSTSQLRSGHPPQEVRYQPQVQQDRVYAPPRSHTPLSRSEHPQHPSLQHAPRSYVDNSNHAMMAQRRDDVPSLNRERDSYAIPDERDRLAARLFDDRDRMADNMMREGQAQQHARIREHEYMRERDARIREDIMRRDMDSRMQGGSPPVGPGLGQRPQEQQRQGQMDWANAMGRQQRRWNDEYRE